MKAVTVSLAFVETLSLKENIVVLKKPLYTYSCKALAEFITRYESLLSDAKGFIKIVLYASNSF